MTAKDELEQSIALFKSALENPIEIFLHSNEDSISHPFDILFKAIEHQALKTTQGNKHEFQYFLSTQMDQALKAWLREREIQEDIKVKVRNPNTFPSLFAVYLGDMEVIQFSIVERIYGTRVKPMTEAELLEREQKFESQLVKQKEPVKQRISDLNHQIEHPLCYIFSWRGFCDFFLKYEKTRERLERLMGYAEKELAAIDQSIHDLREGVYALLKDNKKRLFVFESLRPFFEMLNYTLEEESSKLY